MEKLWSEYSNLVSEPIFLTLTLYCQLLKKERKRRKGAWHPLLSFPKCIFRMGVVCALCSSWTSASYYGLPRWPRYSWLPGVGNGKVHTHAANSVDKGFWWATVHGVTESYLWAQHTTQLLQPAATSLLQAFSMCINHLLNNFFLSSAEITVKSQNSLVYRIDMYKSKLFVHLHFSRTELFKP